MPRPTSDILQWLRAEAIIQKKVAQHNAKVAGGTPISAGFRYWSIAEFLLKNGRAFPSRPLTENEKETVRRAMGHAGMKFKGKQCYTNAQSLTLADTTGKVKYVEGYATNGILPVMHAWNSINGKVVDLTWLQELKPAQGEAKPKETGKKPGKILGTLPKGSAYFGVEIPQRLVWKRWGELKEAGSLIDDPQRGHPLLTRPPRRHPTGSLRSG